jgi:arylsulfatase A-like enzyme
MASRASVMTGLYEYRHGCNFSHGHMQADTWAGSYPLLLRKAGYMTAFAGKFGFHVQGANQGRAFDVWASGGIQSKYDTTKNRGMAKYAKEYPHSTLSYGAFGRDIIKQAKKADRPFCLSISFKAPHRPWTPDPRFDEVYAGRKWTRPGNFGREHADHLSKQSKQGRQWQRWTQWNYDSDYDGVMTLYHRLVYGIDVAIGMIREELDRQGLAENTIIVYTSDNGFLCGSHGYGGKVLPLEESARAPLMIYDPRKPASLRGRRSAALTGNIDFAPTILDWAGADIPEHMDGKSLTPLLADPTRDVHEHLAFINAWPRNYPTTSLSIVRKRWKYTWWWYAGEGMEPDEDLFDTDNDPLELKDLAEDPRYASVMADMRARYDREVAAWKRRVVSYNEYEKFGELFDREADWSAKRKLIGK